MSRVAGLIAAGQFWDRALDSASAARIKTAPGNAGTDKGNDGAQVLDRLDSLIAQRLGASRQAKAAEAEQAAKRGKGQAQVTILHTLVRVRVHLRRCAALPPCYLCCALPCLLLLHATARTLPLSQRHRQTQSKHKSLLAPPGNNLY